MSTDAPSSAIGPPLSLGLGHPRDVSDVAAMIERGLVDRTGLWRLFEAIEPRLIRYPAISPAVFRASVLAICGRTGTI